MNQHHFIDVKGGAWTVCTSCGALRHASQMPGGSPCVFCLHPPAPRQDVPPTVGAQFTGPTGRKWHERKFTEAEIAADRGGVRG